MNDKPECPWRKVTALTGMLTGVYNGHVDGANRLPGVKAHVGRFVPETEAQDLWAREVTLEAAGRELHRREVLEQRILADVRTMQAVIQSWAKAADQFMAWLLEWKGAFLTDGRFVHPNRVRDALIKALNDNGITFDRYGGEEMH